MTTAIATITPAAAPTKARWAVKATKTHPGAYARIKWEVLSTHDTKGQAYAERDRVSEAGTYPVVVVRRLQRTTAEIDAEAQRVMDAWEADERAAGRDPERPGVIGDLQDAETQAGRDPLAHPVVAAWWRLHLAAQRYG